MKRKLKEIIQEASSFLKDDFVMEDIYWLIEEEFHIQKYQIFLRKDEYFEDSNLLKKVKLAVDIPVPYILGYQDFFAYRFKVNNMVLIPRNETEELVDIIIKETNESLTILDIGTGSGCIAITLDKELRKKGLNPQVYGSDISKEALAIAVENNRILNGQVSFLCSDALEDIQLRNIDIIVSNPPYIAKGNYVSKRVIDNEPHIALYAEENGLKVYHKIISKCSTFNRNIILYFEISPDLEQGIIALKNQFLPSHKIRFMKDINGFIRFCVIHV